MADAPKWDGGISWKGCVPWPRREGGVYVCTVPKELGAVTKLYERGGKVVAETESGIQFIVPVSGK